MLVYVNEMDLAISSLFLDFFTSKNSNFEAVKKWEKWTILGLILGRPPYRVYWDPILLPIDGITSSLN